MEHVSTPAADPATPPAAAGFSAALGDLDPSIRIALAEQLVAMLIDVVGDAERTQSALAGFMDLLNGCDPGYPLTAGNLFALLEPLSGAMEDLCGDLAGMLNVRAWRTRAESLLEDADGVEA